MLFSYFDLKSYSAGDLIERMKKIKPLKQIIDDTGIAQSTISTWKQRNVFPKSDDLFKLSQYLNVSMEYLLTGENENDDKLPDSEKKILENYRKLDEHDKHSIDLMIEALAGD